MPLSIYTADQLAFRLEFKRLAFSRAIDRADYHAANIYAAQIEWLEKKLAEKILENNH